MKNQLGVHDVAPGFVMIPLWECEIDRLLLVCSACAAHALAARKEKLVGRDI